METTDTVSLALTADTSGFTASLADAEASAHRFSAGMTSAFSAAEVPARGFSSALADAFTSVAVKGRDLDTVLAGLGQRLSGLALNAALRPLEQGISNSIGQLFASPASAAFARGGVLDEGVVRPYAKGGVLAGTDETAPGGGLMAGVRAFAEGGVVAAPTYFPLASGVGLMGEAGAEAILPLARGTDGALGVRTPAGGGGTTTVNVSVSTPDAGAFRRSDAYLSGLVARAVARGQRSL